MSKHPGADRWAMFILERNMNVHKFFKYLGFHIEKIFVRLVAVAAFGDLPDKGHRGPVAQQDRASDS